MTAEGTVIIDRPYDTLDEFLEGDAWTVQRGDMLLLGVIDVELGSVVEFAITLTTGETVVAGEGRAVELYPRTEEFVGGTRVKFRKLDAESKAILKRALEIQRQRAAAEAAAASAMAEELPSSAVQDLPPSGVAHDVPAAGPDLNGERPGSEPPAPVEPPAAAAPLPSPPQVAPLPSAAAAAAEPPADRPGRPTRVAPPPNRDALLDRLRARRAERGTPA